MYIPEHFRNEDRATALAFMRANPFVILVSNTDDVPFATHVPVVIRESADQLTIRGHVAKANPHWRYLQKDPTCLMIFHGPHAYISPSNYDTREVVPTWNYGAVHIYGNATTYAETDQLLNMLHDLIPTFHLLRSVGRPERFRGREPGVDLQGRFTGIGRSRRLRLGEAPLTLSVLRHLHLEPLERAPHAQLQSAGFRGYSSGGPPDPAYACSFDVVKASSTSGRNVALKRLVI